MNTQPPTRQRKTGTGAKVSSQPRKTEYIYHWNRILGALIGLVLLFGLIGFGIHTWLSSPSSTGPADLDAVDIPGPRLEVAPEPIGNGVGATAAEPAQPDATPGSDAVPPPDAVVPLEEGIPEQSDAAETADQHLSPVFLPPGTRVNLRAAPSLSSPVLRILDSTAELQLLDTRESFYQVRSSDGIAGWISRDFASLRPYSTPSR
jgi:hypothetical protein